MGTVLVGCLAAATVAIFALAGVYDTFAGDLAILEALHLDDSWRRFFGHFDLVIGLSVGMVLVVAVPMFLWRRWPAGVVALLILPSQGLTILLPKAAIGRPRPEGGLAVGNDSFPSGTAGTSMMVFGLVLYFVGLYVVSRPLRLGLQALLGAVILAMGTFRMLANEHFPSDVLGGYLIGGLVLVGLVWIYRALQHRWPVEVPGRNHHSGGDSCAA